MDKSQTENKTYIICQTGSCAKTYPMSHFGVTSKDTKNIACDKCGGVLVDHNGKADMTSIPDVITFIEKDELDKQKQKQKQKQIEEYRKVIKNAQAKIDELINHR